jgi:hypothetical protein
MLGTFKGVSFHFLSEQNNKGDCINAGLDTIKKELHTSGSDATDE